MKKITFIILALSFNLTLNSQTISLGKFPSEKNESTPMLTSDLLRSLDWKNLKSFSNLNEGHFAYERKDSLLFEYEYFQRGRQANFKIISFKGKILEYKGQITNTSKEMNTNYFDKNVWLEYAHSYLTNLPDSLKLTVSEPKDILVAYYKLLGVETRDEYGWICEYSTVPDFTDRRKAVIKLLNNSRVDLLKPLMKHPNLEISMYTIDAMIYHDFRSEQKVINQIIPNYLKLFHELDSLKSNNYSSYKLLNNPKEMKYIEKRLAKLNQETLSSKDWEYICQLKESNQEVRVCKDGTGSFKIYEECTTDLLSEASILEIINKYKEWQELGYVD
ncbi:MAG: hypothetical protein LAT51_01950 [Flavobacteriaceae bacterium]|nr:hypothetical protein [Flavobacteriaceae bacterium]